MVKNINKYKIEKLYASKGDFRGEIDLVWDPVENASGYVIQVSKLNGQEKWKQVDIVTKSHCTITGLRPSQTYRIRAASISNSTQNEWSEITTEKAT